MRLLLFARLSYRMRDYARMLTIVTVLNAVVLTGLGALYGGLQSFQLQAVHLTPFALQLLSNDAQPTALTPEQVRQEIARQRLALQAATDTSFIGGSVAQGQYSLDASIMSYTDFTRLQAAEREAHPDFAENQRNIAPLASDSDGYFFTPDFVPRLSNQQSQLVIGQTTASIHLRLGSTRVLDEWFGGPVERPTTNVAVVTDALYARLARSTLPTQRWRVSSYTLPDWQQSASLVAALRQRLPGAQQPLLTDTVTNYDDGVRVFSVQLFVDFFISLLFFLAAASAIYLKLFTQEEVDRRQFRALERIGFQRHEAARLLNRELLLLFFLPIALASLHSAVALLDATAIMGREMVGGGELPVSSLTAIMLQALGLASLLYIACFAVYFWVARVGYLRRMRLAAS